MGGTSITFLASRHFARGLRQPPPQTKDDTAIWSLRHIQILWSWAARPKRVPYPPIASIPCTSVARLSEPDVAPIPFPSEPILAKSFHPDAPAKPKTVLYLAYGSNMCAETFLGMRGIRPLSQVNVSAPSLDLTFDLPGVPYREPCFANTAIRKIPGKRPPLNPPKFPPGIPDHPPFEPPVPVENTAAGPPGWDKGLYGIVYEVTTEEWARIVATEGGGASYHDILVPCLVLPPSVSVPEKPTIPVPPPMPFLAHTLYAPRLPDKPDNNKKSMFTLPGWLTSLLLPARRPHADYAQPSARYLKLLTDGAREHDLPAEYQAYLGSLQPYTITTGAQKAGQVLFLGFWAPIIICLMMSGRVLGDERGRSPPWLMATTTVMFNLVWRSYDLVAARVFGDGERTIEEDEDEDKYVVGRVKERRASFVDGLRGKEEVADEEKRALMDGYR
ncbi:hypothetical protein C8A00DRAFT_45998 [Chaetomidium leptoderma]|uniref:gamma-glutamylcyclotransferase n=1 Tax=Chaetomidium leptoderma TaxID=669021 RepID=A0AAN6VGJ2_9PEZI|nr:hypothetical protein C8A00DRAFT_45998 [Chaetomidium leptoderma]